jgi:hypothetical protein
MSETAETTERASDAGQHLTDDTEYRIERLRHRLAHGETAELGLRIEARANAVVVSGTVATAECRAEIVHLVEEELAGLPVRLDVTVAPAPVEAKPLVEEL